MMKKLILSVLFVCSLSLAQMPNYFYTTLTGTITSTDTTCQIASSDTTYFGSRTNFCATIWDTYYSSPSHARSRGGKYETVLIESRSGLTLQIVRARLGSTAQNFNTAGRTYRITAEVLNDIYDSLNVALTNDSVDIPIVTTFGGASMGNQTTLYAGLNAPQLATSEASVNYAPIGIAGRVIAMYFQSKTNTCTVAPTITFQYGDTTASSLTPSSIAITPALGQKAKSITGQTLNVTASQLGGFKYVNSSGSGSITFPTLTIVIRTKLN